MGQGHDGSLGLAHAFIDAIATAGADAVKFQTHIAAAESTPREPWRVTFSRQDATRYDYWKRMEFTEAQWLGLSQHAEECGLAFLSSPFSHRSRRPAASASGVAAWKVASGEIDQRPDARTDGRHRPADPLLHGYERTQRDRQGGALGARPATCRSW